MFAGLLILVGRLGVHGGHFSLKLLDVIFADYRLGDALPGEFNEVGWAIDACLAQVGEALHDVVGVPSGLAPSVAPTAVIAPDDRAQLPPFQPVER